MNRLERPLSRLTRLYRRVACILSVSGVVSLGKREPLTPFPIVSHHQTSTIP